MGKGLIQIYCGDGKGKTTATVGLTVRAAGRGLKVLLTNFLKDFDTGELIAFEKYGLGIEVVKGTPVTKLYKFMTDEEKAATTVEHRQRFEDIIAMVEAEKYDLLIFDEAIGALNHGILEQRQMMEFLRSKPQGLEVVLTGRNPSAELLEIADYVSEICCRKHPFTKGITARLGIER